MIKELLDGGQTISDEEDIKQYVRSFYHHLYTKDPLVENNIQARLQCLNNVPTIIIEDQNMFLLQTFSNIEVQRATMDLSKHKTPRVDGIPMEFFHEMWQEIGKDIKTFCKRHFKKEGCTRSLRLVYNHSSQSWGIIVSSLIIDQSQCWDLIGINIQDCFKNIG
jgi:hypothetical protein